MAGRLPTTRLLRYVYAAVDKGKWFDFANGKEVPNYDPKTALPTPLASSRPSSIGYLENPPREPFMVVGHCWWGLLLGYLAGLFAGCVYARRRKDETSLAAEHS